MAVVLRGLRQGVYTGGFGMTTPNKDTVINCEWQDVCDAGYCNACTNRTIRKVYVMTFRSLSIRLCRQCRSKLIRELRGAS